MLGLRSVTVKALCLAGSLGRRHAGHLRGGVERGIVGDRAGAVAQVVRGEGADAAVVDGGPGQRDPGRAGRAGRQVGDPRAAAVVVAVTTLDSGPRLLPLSMALMAK